MAKVRKLNIIIYTIIALFSLCSLFLNVSYGKDPDSYAWFYLFQLLFELLVIFMLIKNFFSAKYLIILHLFASLGLWGINIFLISHKLSSTFPIFNKIDEILFSYNLNTSTAYIALPIMWFIFCLINLYLITKSYKNREMDKKFYGIIFLFFGLLAVIIDAALLSPPKVTIKFENQSNKIKEIKFNCNDQPLTDLMFIKPKEKIIKILYPYCEGGLAMELKINQGHKETYKLIGYLLAGREEHVNIKISEKDDVEIKVRSQVLWLKAQ